MKEEIQNLLLEEAVKQDFAESLADTLESMVERAIEIQNENN